MSPMLQMETLRNKEVRNMPKVSQLGREELECEPRNIHSQGPTLTPQSVFLHSQQPLLGQAPCEVVHRS